MYRRNFTFGIASPSSPTDGGQWASSGGGATDWSLYGSGQFPPGTDGGDVRAIACAINTFGQADIFQSEYNAYCYNGGKTTGGKGNPLTQSLAYRNELQIILQRTKSLNYRFWNPR